MIARERVSLYKAPSFSVKPALNPAVSDLLKPCTSLAAALQQQGWFVSDGFISEALITALNQDLNLLEANHHMTPAGIGRAEQFQHNHAIRRDSTFWLRGDTLAQCQLLAIFEQLRLYINRTLFMGLFEFEGHYAVYPPNGFYQKHRDSFAGQTNRVLSVVLYLNQHWVPADGGELVLYDQNDPKPIECITPIAGRAVIFLSEEIPHEVLLTRVTRRSVAGWFRVNNSLLDQIDPAL